VSNHKPLPINFQSIFNQSSINPMFPSLPISKGNWSFCTKRKPAFFYWVVFRRGDIFTFGWVRNIWRFNHKCERNTWCDTLNACKINQKTQAKTPILHNTRWCENHWRNGTTPPFVFVFCSFRSPLTKNTPRQKHPLTKKKQAESDIQKWRRTPSFRFCGIST